MKVKPNRKLKKVAYRYSKVAGFLLIISMIVVALAFMWYFKWGENYKPVVDKDFVLYYKTEMENEYRYLQIQSLTKSFEVDGKQFCLAMDRDGIYAVAVNEEILKELEDIQKFTYAEITETPEKKVLEGRTAKIDYKLKEKIIEEYNKTFQTSYLTKDNFEDVAGTLYLDLTQKTYTPYLNFAIGFALVFGVTGIFFFLYMISAFLQGAGIISKIKQSGELAKLNEQLEKGEILEIKKYGVLLTDDYILDGTKSFMVAKYSNIKWMYPVTDKKFGKKADKSIMVETQDGNRRKMVTLPDKAKKEIDDIYRYIISRSPNIISRNEPTLQAEIKAMQEDEALNQAFGEVDAEKVEELEELNEKDVVEEKVEVKSEKKVVKKIEEKKEIAEKEEIATPQVKEKIREIKENDFGRAR